MKDRFSKVIVDSNFIFRALASNSNDYIYIWDFVNGSYKAAPNLSEEFAIELEGNDIWEAWASFINIKDCGKTKKIIAEAIKFGKTKVEMECQATNSKGKRAWIGNKFTILYNEKNGEPEIIIGIMHNLSDDEIDSITGLQMHYKCREGFDLHQRGAREQHGALMLLGIDGFTSINTLNSYTFGDLVLKNTVQDLMELLPENAVMYRYAGDQLLIIFDKGTVEDAIGLYKNIKKYASISHKIQEKPYRFTFSAGIAAYPRDGILWNDLEKAVSIALARAKEMGKDLHVEFTNAMLEKNIHTQLLRRHLADSLENEFNGFDVVFQPICYAQNLKIRGAEILLRFTTQEGAKISPDEFIPLLEQSKMIIPVGMWVLERAIEICKRWSIYNEDFVMNVNVSYIQLRDIRFCDKVEALLKKYDLDVKHITLELTESHFITDASGIDVSLKQLRNLNMKIAMDDFGTGYSSLAQLATFNVDVVKIDKSLVQSLHNSKYNYDFVEAVVRLCHNVGMKICVEGVEQRDEQESICVLNADFVQGFYVSRPVGENIFCEKYILRNDANDSLIVVPNVQLRHEQLTSDRDVLSAMMDATPLGLVFWGRNAEIIACNMEVLTMFDMKDFKDFRENFFQFSPTRQPDGKKSMEKTKELIREAFSGQKVRTYWQHCKRDGEIIPTEITIVRIPYMEDYIAASYTRDMRGQRELEEKIEKFNLRLEAILDATPLCLNLWNHKFENVMCNKVAVSLFGLQDQQEYLDRFSELSPKYQPDGRLSDEKSAEYITRAFNSDHEIQFEWMHRKLNGEEIHAEITLIKIEGLDEEGGPLVAGYTRDLRTQLEAERAQESVTARIRAVVDSSPLACTLWSEDLNMVDCNKVAVNMFGAANEEEVLQNFDYFMPQCQPDGEDSLIKKARRFEEILKRNRLKFEWVYLNKQREEIPCEITMVRIPLEKESVIVVYSRDLRELHSTLELNDRLSKMAYFDLLTGVSSRARIVERLEANFEKNQADKFALILFDIDHFKTVNDTYGHAAGDMVLKRIAKSVEKMLPNNAILGRFGGDEFIICLERIDKKTLSNLMKQIVHSVSNILFNYEKQKFTTSISMGASFKKEEDEDYNQLVNRADQALYKIKENGRNNSAIW